MQTAQNSGGASQIPTAQNMQNTQNNGTGVPFPQPGIPPGQAATGPNILSVLAVALGGLHDSTADRFGHLDAVVRDLASTVTAVRDAARVDSLKLAEWLDKSHERQMKATMLVLERVRALEQTVGEVKSLHGDETITARMQRIDCALTELLEQVQDPDAEFAASRPHASIDFTPRPARHFMNRSVSPIAPAPVYVDAGVDAHTTEHADACVTASVPLPTLVDVSVGTERKVADVNTATISLEVVDVGVVTNQALLVDAAVGSPSRQYVDSGIDAPSSEDTDRMRTPARTTRSLHVFGSDTRFHARFPTSPYHSDPMVPAQWSPDSPRSELSYLNPDVVAPDTSLIDTSSLTQPRSADNIPSTSSLPLSPEHPAPTEVSHPQRSSSTSSIGIVQSTSETTAVDSPVDSAIAPTAIKPTSATNLLSTGLPLPRGLSHRVNRTRPVARLSTSPSPSPPPPPPLPRRKVKELPRTQPKASSSIPTQTTEPVRGRKPDPRESSSPEIQIIEKPAAFDENRNKSRDHDKSKSQAKHQKKSKAQTRGRSTDLDAERPRKKRKTDGDKVAETVKRPVKKPRKSEGAAASKSQKGKQPAKGSSDSSPQAGPSPQEDDRIIADHPLCKWPDTISGDENYQREFINCDNCDAWFHYGCVGLAADDPRLTEEDSKFFCPPCEVATEEREGQHASQQNKTAQCARPDCQSSETGQWFIECIVGRRPSLTQPSNNGVPKFLWLVKWSGYEMKDATWEFPENLGDPAQLVSEFEVAAELENKDLSDPHKPTLLNEAAKCWS